MTFTSSPLLFSGQSKSFERLESRGGSGEAPMKGLGSLQAQSIHQDKGASFFGLGHDLLKLPAFGCCLHQAGRGIGGCF